MTVLTRNKHWSTRAEYEASEVEDAIMRDEEKPCSRRDCYEPVAKGGLCAEHYLAAVDDRFRSSYEAVPWSGCWLWTGPVNEGGYGLLAVGSANILAHRYSYSRHTGRKIADKYYVCHSCDIPCCVNPAHLFEGTPRQNLVDAMRKNRLARTLTKEKVRMIYRMDASGAWRTADIARVVGLPFGTVADILAGRRWDLGVRGEVA